VEFRQRRARRAHQRKSLTQGGGLKVVEHLGGKDCVEEGTEITESLRVLWKLCQEGIE
jgi:hypothetical protein